MTLPITTLTTRVLGDPRDHAAWNGFVASRPEGDVLQAWEWAGVKSADWTPLRIGVFHGDSIVAGAAILRRKLPLVGCIYYAPRGPLLADWSDRRALQILLDAVRVNARRDGAAFFKIDPAVTIERTDAHEILVGEGFQTPTDTDAQGFGGTQPRCVMQLDLAGRTEAELLASFKPTTRRNIKLAIEKHGVEVLGAELTRDHLQVFDEIMRTTGARDGFRPRPLSYFQSLWDNLVTADLGRLFLTRCEGQFLSGALCFCIGDKSWYVYGASSNEMRNVMPNYAMQWAMIRWARDRGCSWYDFRGVSPRRRQEGENTEALEQEDHLQGLNRFKEGFGTRYVEYIGERDLVFNKVAYWAYTTGKPRAQAMVRRIKRP